VVNDKVVGVIDVDCTVLEGFDEEDAIGLQGLSDLLAKGCDW
jgi:L-methionine (R)-S-oxide reductase